MLRLVNMTVAGTIKETSKEEVVIEAHGNSIKLNAVNFVTQPKVGQTVFIEMCIYKTELKTN